LKVLSRIWQVRENPLCLPFAKERTHEVRWCNSQSFVFARWHSYCF
jgi:hypothetical protein